MPVSQSRRLYNIGLKIRRVLLHAAGQLNTLYFKKGLVMNKYILWLLYVVLFFYCVNDAYQTKLLLELGAHEMNPLVRWIMDVTGTWLSVLFFKVFLLLGLGILLIKYNQALDVGTKSSVD